MKRASQEAIDQAYKILLGSFESENAEFASKDDVYEDAEACNSALDATIGEISRRIQGLFAKRRRRRNAGIPISRLPDEVLILIFEAHIRTYRDVAKLPPEMARLMNRTFQYAVLDLALECKLWHNVVFNAPSLWNSFSLSMPDTHAQNALQLSRGLPLTVDCSTDDVEVVRRTITSNKMIKFSGLMIENSSRIQEALFDVPLAGLLAFTPFLLLPNPHIKHVIVKYNFYKGQIYPDEVLNSIKIFLFQGQASYLRTLVVEWAPILWERLSFKTLVVSLALNDIPATPEDSAQLQSSESLLDFPALRNMALQSKSDFVNSFLSTLQSPPFLETLVLLINFEREPESELTGAAFATLDAILAQILTTPSESRPKSYSATARLPRAGERLHITADGNWLLFHYAESINVQFTGRATNLSALNWAMGLATRSGFSGPVELHIRNDTLALFDSAVWGSLSNINVWMLFIGERAISNEADRSDSLRALSSLCDFLKQRIHRNGTLQSVWPILKHLEINFVDLPSESILELLESRYSDSTSSEAPRTLALVLACTRLNQSLLDRLKQSPGLHRLEIKKRTLDQISTNGTEDHTVTVSQRCTCAGLPAADVRRNPAACMCFGTGPERRLYLLRGTRLSKRGKSKGGRGGRKLRIDPGSPDANPSASGFGGGGPSLKTGRRRGSLTRPSLLTTTSLLPNPLSNRINQVCALDAQNPTLHLHRTHIIPLIIMTRVFTPPRVMLLLLLTGAVNGQPVLPIAPDHTESTPVAGSTPKAPASNANSSSMTSSSSSTSIASDYSGTAPEEQVPIKPSIRGRRRRAHP